MRGSTNLQYKHGQKTKFIAAAVFCMLLMLVDSRYDLLQPLRSTAITILQPVEYVVRQPIVLVKAVHENFRSKRRISQEKNQALKALNLKALDASREQWLLAENQKLRRLLDLKEQIMVQTTAAQVLNESANPFAHRVQINRGSAHDVAAGDVVIDDNGVVGQVIRVYPYSSEVRLIIDQNHILPVQNLRTNQQGLIYGMPRKLGFAAVELRYMTKESDIAVDDLLVTSGNDNVYVAGIPVAIVEKVESSVNSPFLNVFARPVANIDSLYHVLIVKQTSDGQAIDPTAVGHRSELREE